MRNFKNVLVLALMLVGFAGSAWAGPQDFRLYNRTGVDIYAVHVCPADADDWQENLIEGAQLMNGAELDIEFHPDEEVELWDLRVEDQEGNALYWEDLDLMKAYEIVIEPNGKARVKDVE